MQPHACTLIPVASGVGEFLLCLPVVLERSAVWPYFPYVGFVYVVSFHLMAAQKKALTFGKGGEGKVGARITPLNTQTQTHYRKENIAHIISIEAEADL